MHKTETERTLSNVIEAVLHQLENGEASDGDRREIRFCAQTLREAFEEWDKASTRTFGYDLAAPGSESKSYCVELEHVSGSLLEDGKATMRVVRAYLWPEPTARQEAIYTRNYDWYTDVPEGEYEGTWKRTQHMRSGLACEVFDVNGRELILAGIGVIPEEDTAGLMLGDRVVITLGPCRTLTTRLNKIDYHTRPVRIRKSE